jgi:hypothetical protein
MSEQPATQPQGARPKILYQIAGDANQEVNLLGMRDRIRNGTLQPADEVAVVGTDLWKPASDYPELTRYFALLQRAVSAAAPQPVTPLASRILPGIAYPFTSLSSIAVVFIIPAARLILPLLSIVFALLGMVYMCGVIRKSSEGQTRAPSLAEVGGAGEWAVGLYRVIAVTLISAWPVFLLGVLMVTGLARSIFLFPVALIVMMLYFPASLATVALWKNIKMALSIQQIFRFIGVLGGDYYAVIGIWIVMLIVVGVVNVLMRSVLADQARLLALIDLAASTWISLYASHLLGWAIHRHRDQL